MVGYGAGREPEPVPVPQVAPIADHQGDPLAMVTMRRRAEFAGVMAVESGGRGDVGEGVRAAAIERVQGVEGRTLPGRTGR